MTSEAKRSLAFVAILALALVAVALRWVHPGYVIAQGDINPPNDLWKQAAACARAWNYTQSYLGQPSACLSYAPVLYAHAAMAAIAGSSAGDALSMIFPLVLAATGAFTCARFLRFSPLASFVAGLTLTVNPYVQVLIGLNTTAALLAAVFAWICAMLAWGAADPARRGTATFVTAAICAIPVASLGITPQLLVELVIGVLVWIAFVARDVADLAAYFRWLLRLGGVAIAVSAWWLLPSIVAVVSSQNARPTSIASNAWTDARASLLNLLRLNPVWLWSGPLYFPDAAAYDANPLTYASGACLYATTLAGLLVSRGSLRRMCAWFGLAALVLLFFTKGAHEPLAWLSTFVVSLPVLFVLQEPAGLIFVAIFFLALTAAALVDGVRRGARRAIVAIVIVAATCVSAELMIGGRVLHAATPAASSMYVKVPAYWEAIGAFLDSSREDGGVLVLPDDATYQVRYAWDYQGADTIPLSVTNRRVLLPGPPFGYFQTPARSAVYGKLMGLIASGSPLARVVARDLGIRFVIVRGDVAQYSATLPDSSVEQALKPQSRRSIGPLKLYDLGHPRAELTAWSVYIATDAGDAGTIEELAALEREPQPRLAPSSNELGSPQLREVDAEHAGRGDRAFVTDPPRAFDTSTDSRDGTATVSFGRGFPAKPQVDGPYQILATQRGDAPAGAPQALISVVPNLSGAEEFRVLNPSTQSGKARLVLHCHACSPGEAVIVRANGVRHTSTVRENAGALTAAFDRVALEPHLNALSLSLPAGVIRSDDIFFSEAKVPPERYGGMDFAATRVRLSDHPFISAVNFDEAVATQGTMLAFLSVNGRPFVCPSLMDGGLQYEIFVIVVDCLRENFLDHSVNALRRVDLLGIGIVPKPGTHDLHSVQLMSLRWNPEAELRRKVTAIAPGKWIAGDGIAAGDLLDVSNDAPGTLNVTGRSGGGFSLPLRDFTGSSAAGARTTQRVVGPAAAALTARLPNENLRSSELHVWRAVRTWAIRVGATLLHGNVDGPPVLNLPFRNAAPQTNSSSPGIPSASLVAIGVSSRPAKPVAACSPRSSAESIVSCAVPRASIVTMNVGYHPGWIALSHGRILDHVVADGWRNAWVVTAPGTIYVVDTIDVSVRLLQYLAATICIGLALLAVRRRA